MWNTNERAPNSPITDERIASAEQQLRVKLPDSYLDALRIKNGGSIAGDLVKLPAQEIPDHLRPFVSHGYVSVRGINGIGESDTSLLKTGYLIAEWGLPEDIVILDGDGHWWIAFDYRNGGNDPRVVFVDSHSGDTLHIADDFAQFFGSFVDDEDVFDEDGNYIGG